MRTTAQPAPRRVQTPPHHICASARISLFITPRSISIRIFMKLCHNNCQVHTIDAKSPTDPTNRGRSTRISYIPPLYIYNLMKRKNTFEPTKRRRNHVALTYWISSLIWTQYVILRVYYGTPIYMLRVFECICGWVYMWMSVCSRLLGCSAEIRAV